MIDSTVKPPKEAAVGTVALEGGALAKLTSVGGDVEWSFTPQRALAGASAGEYIKLFFAEVAEHLGRRGRGDAAVVIAGSVRADMAALKWVDGADPSESSSSIGGGGSGAGTRSAVPPSHALLARRWAREHHGAAAHADTDADDVADAGAADSSSLSRGHTGSHRCGSSVASSSGSGASSTIGVRTAEAEAAALTASSAAAPPVPVAKAPAASRFAGAGASAAAGPAARAVLPDADGWYTVVRDGPGRR